MELDVPDAGEPPLAKILGIQFGLMTTTDILKLSVFEENQSLAKPKDMLNPRLGLPAAVGRCTTCGGGTIDECQGHFGHVLLPTPIVHPNLVGRLIRLLRRICLNCGKPRKKANRLRKASLVNSSKGQGVRASLGQKVGSSKRIPKVVRTPKALETGVIDGSPSSSRSKRKLAEEPVEEEAADLVVVLSSDEEDFSCNSRKQQKVHGPTDDDESDHEGKATTSSVRRSWNFRKRKIGTDFPTESNAALTKVVDLTNVEKWNPLVCVKKSKKDEGRISKSAVEVVNDGNWTSKGKESTNEHICKYCSASSRYPEVQLKVDVKETSRSDIGNLVKHVKMEIKDKDLKDVAPDYWSFVEGRTLVSPMPSHQTVRRTRVLLPSEALKILRKIPDDALAGLGMNAAVARPEAMIVECLVVPPNCTRMQEEGFGNAGTNIGFSIGIDRATQCFAKLLNKINSIKASRFGQPTFHAALSEAGDLQALFGMYLREKGAPKAAPGKEKKRVDHAGRVQKRDSRWSLDWLKRNVLGKRSGFSARNVVTGDPFLRVEEIGIPLEVAKYVTYPERVNKFNQNKLQECIEIGQTLGRSRVCGAVRILRNGERREVTRRTAITLEIGDIVHRHLKDGDLLYINRPPSLHKHSLIALKAHIQDMATFTINPAVCAPLHADFDGDCLHVFVPQSEETKAELHQLLTIPRQILPSQEGKTILGLSQDNILATHLVTFAPLFLSKEVMYQLAMWSSWKVPIPAIVKAPKVGPLWTGKQVIDLTIPDNFSFQSMDGAVVINDGELLSYGGKANWLASTSGLVSTLAQYSAEVAVKHLDCAQAVLREWLLSHGFSLSLGDFYVASDQFSRQKMTEELMDSVEHAQGMAVNKKLIFNGRLQKLEVVHRNTEASCRDSGQSILEDIAVNHFLDNFNEIGEQFGDSIDKENCLLAMVRSGSKGSVAKVFQQIGCLGLQLYKGEHLLPLRENNKFCHISSSTTLEEKWEARGLVKSSLLDGLEPLEFFLHAIAVRAGLLRQSMEVTEPGELFKRLMLFLRDVHVAYDGTVRNKCGMEIIQFYYEGVKSPTGNEDVPISWKESVMPGEAVGILAATAIAQPAYQVMLEANHNMGSKKIRPLALLQETMFPRSTSSLKDTDRRSILRLSQCSCGVQYCEERRILHVQHELQPLTLKMLATATAIEYVEGKSEEWDKFFMDDVKQKLCMPWIGHIQLDKVSLMEHSLSQNMILKQMKKRFEGSTKLLRKYQLGQPLLSFRDACDCMGGDRSKSPGPCLHFSPIPSSSVKRRKVKRVKDATLELIDKLQSFLMPLILNSIIKGDDRIESTKIVWEDAAWSPPGRSDVDEYVPNSPNGELVLEVTVKEKMISRRGASWAIAKEACIPVMDTIDWRRSAPYSVQEIRHSLGLEAARDSILQRFNLATQASGNLIGRQHLKLVADLMVHSGEVHGLTSYGHRDLIQSLKTSAPFTSGAFRAPIKNFMEAGEKGGEEILSGVLASCVFGKRVPVGTGSDFSLNLRPKFGSVSVEDTNQSPDQSVDIFEYLMELNSTIGVESPETPPLSEVKIDVTHGDVIQEDEVISWTPNISKKTRETTTSAWDEGGWGAAADSGPLTESCGGAWGAYERRESAHKPNSGWGDDPEEQDGEGGARGAYAYSESASKPNSGWGDDPEARDSDSGAWGANETRKSAPKPNSGWGDHTDAEDRGGGDSGAWGVNEKRKSAPKPNSGWEDDTDAENLGGGGWDAHEKSKLVRKPNSPHPQNEDSDGRAPSEAAKPNKCNDGWSDWVSSPSKDVDGWGVYVQSSVSKKSNTGWGDDNSEPTKSLPTGGWGGRNHHVTTKESNVDGWGSYVVPGPSMIPPPATSEDPVSTDGTVLVATTVQTGASGWDEETVAHVTSSEWGSSPRNGLGKRSHLRSSSGGGFSAAGQGWGASELVGGVGGWEGRPTQPGGSTSDALLGESEEENIKLDVMGENSNSGWCAVNDTNNSPIGWNVEVPSEGGWNNVSQDTRATWSAEQAVEQSSWTCEYGVGAQKREGQPWSQSGRSGERNDHADTTRRSEGREFRPTGANTIPLGKVRQFGPREITSEGVISANCSNPSGDFHAANAGDVLGSFNPSMEARWMSQPGSLQKESVGGTRREAESECIDETFHVGETGSVWECEEDDKRNSDSGWGSYTPDIQTGAGNEITRALPETGCYTRESTRSWSSGQWRSDGGDHRLQASLNNESQIVLPTKRDQSWRRPDPRRESEDWKELESLGRRTKNILRTYEVEERLKGEDNTFMLTKVLPHHPNIATKTGCGINFIKVAKHMETTCFFLVRTDGTTEDFSYHKCLQTLASRKQPSLLDLYKLQFMRGREFQVPLESPAHLDTIACNTPYQLDSPAPTQMDRPADNLQSRLDSPCHKEQTMSTWN